MIEKKQSNKKSSKEGNRAYLTKKNLTEYKTHCNVPTVLLHFNMKQFDIKQWVQQLRT